jgi:putative transposase
VDGSDIKVCIIPDDASRKVLAGGEFSNINSENSRLILDQVVDRYWWLRPMREPMMDHGSEFGAHRVLKALGLAVSNNTSKSMVSGQFLERFFREYKRHRSDFSFNRQVHELA